MPLSKDRDKERKRRQRLKVRLEKLLLPPQKSKAVQPVIPNNVDADGNIIPEYY